MKNNNLPEGFKMTELGPIPEDWEVKFFNDIGEFQYGYTETAIKKEIGPKFLRITDIDLAKSQINWVSVPYCKISDEDYPKYKLNKGDILIARIGATTGKSCIIKNPPKSIFASYLIRFKIDRNKAYPLFVYYFTTGEKYWNEIGASKEGKLKKGVSSSQLKNFKIPLPPLPEQKKIAAVLSAVQEAKEKTEEVIRAAKELKKSLMKHLFNYGPVSLEEAEKVKLKETDIGLVPEEWEVVRLGEVFKLASGKTRPKNLKPVSSNNFIYPVFGGNGIMGYSEEYMIDFKTIILGRVGEYCGSVHISKDKSWVSDNALYVKNFFRTDVSIPYLALALTILNLNRLKKKSSQPLITQSLVYSQIIPLPPISTQQKIAEILSAVDEKIQAEENKKKALEDLFKTLLNNLMTANIRVNELNLSIN